MKFDMNIKTKLTVSIGVLVAMIVLLVSLSVTNLQILTATEPDSPAAEPGMNRALTWIMIIGGICICIGLWILFKIPNSINSPFKSLVKGILEIANHNYDAKLDLRGDKELEEVSKNFNRMAKRLKDYHNSTISDLMASKRYLETIINSINEPIVGLDNEQIILFINNEALNILNLKREDVIRKSAQEIAMRNDLLRRLICGMWEDKKKEQEAPKSKRESLKIYADNKESYFQVENTPLYITPVGSTAQQFIGNLIVLNNVTKYKELDSAKTNFISTVSHEMKTPISSILMSLQLLGDTRLGQLNGEQKQLVGSIKDSSDRLLNITGELLNMTQVESGKLKLMPKVVKPVELIDYAVHATQILAERFHCFVEIDYPEKISKLFVDNEKIAIEQRFEVLQFFAAERNVILKHPICKGEGRQHNYRITFVRNRFCHARGSESFAAAAFPHKNKIEFFRCREFVAKSFCRFIYVHYAVPLFVRENRKIAVFKAEADYGTVRYAETYYARTRFTVYESRVTALRTFRRRIEHFRRNSLCFQYFGFF